MIVKTRVGFISIDFISLFMESKEMISSEMKAGLEQMSSKTVKEIDEAKEVENLKKLEAALFISARFLNLQELVMLTDINPLMLKELIEKLIEKYNKEDSAIEIISKENMWKMDVRQEYVDMINKLATGSAEFTKAEQETLAVLAYKQPVKQSIIIKIRGNKAYEHIKHFIEIGLVKAKKLGHTKELRLSDEFFEYFHLVNKNQKNAIKGIDFSGIQEKIEESEEENNKNGKRKVEKIEKKEEDSGGNEKIIKLGVTGNEEKEIMSIKSPESKVEIIRGDEDGED